MHYSLEIKENFKESEQQFLNLPHYPNMNQKLTGSVVTGKNITAWQRSTAKEPNKSDIKAIKTVQNVKQV